MRRERRQPTKAELRALGATPGLIAHRVGPDGRSRLEQLTADNTRRESFARRLTGSGDDRRSQAGEEC
jgi:hypothetical protein